MSAVIKIKNSSTASAVPVSGDLVQGELAVNVADKRVFTKDATSAIVELGINPSSLTTASATITSLTTSGAASFADGSASAPAITNTGDTNTGIFFPAADTIAFATNGTEDARFDSAGNFGLGVTPSAWSVLRGFDIGTSSNSAAIASNPEGLYLTQNSFFNGTSWIYKANGLAARYQQVAGVQSWWTAPTGTAGNAITFTQAMTLDASGNLLVGTTSASNRRVASFVGNSVSTSNYYAESGTGYTGAHFYGASSTAAGTGWYHFVGQSSGPVNNVFIYGNGNIQNANNSYAGISDIKLKENIVDATPKLEKLCQVRVRNYNLIGDYENHKQIGVIAQELEQIFPGMVEETPDYEEVTVTDEEGNETTERVATGTTTKSVKYSVFVPMLIKALQEQQALIDAQQAALTSLTARIEALEA
jgi:hypothetical protein